MPPIALVLVLSLALVLVCSAVPWLARRLHGRHLVIALVVGLVVGIAAGIVGAARALSLSPVTDLMVLVVAWSGGALLGRGLPARFGAFLPWFLCFSAFDVLQAVGGYPVVPHTAGDASPLAWTTFHLVLPTGPFAINGVDLLLLTALAEHWRRRGASYVIALLPGALGVLLADGFILVTRLSLVPAIPCFTLGYALTEGVYRSLSRHRAPPSATCARSGTTGRAV
jgi:hypothetical protein